MTNEEKRFGILLADFKSKGMSDDAALLAASDQYLFEQFKWQSAKDADFEIVPPKQLPPLTNKNDEP